MKERESDTEWNRGWFLGRRSRFGFGLWFGLFLLGWGAFELAIAFGYLKGVSFPFWPLLLIMIGLSIILRRI